MRDMSPKASYHATSIQVKENCLEVFQQPENGRYTSYRSLKAGSAFVCGNGKQVMVGSVLV